MPNRKYPNRGQVFRGQPWQHFGVDVVIAERRPVLLEPEATQPCRNVHARLPNAVNAALSPYFNLSLRANPRAATLLRDATESRRASSRAKLLLAKPARQLPVDEAQPQPSREGRHPTPHSPYGENRSERREPRELRAHLGNRERFSDFLDGASRAGQPGADGGFGRLLANRRANVKLGADDDRPVVSGTLRAARSRCGTNWPALFRALCHPSSHPPSHPAKTRASPDGERGCRVVLSLS